MLCLDRRSVICLYIYPYVNLTGCLLSARADRGAEELRSGPEEMASRGAGAEETEGAAGQI